MDALRQEANYQCTVCGEIHSTRVDKAIDLGDDIYYATVCPHCRGVKKHLFVGENSEDKYLLADVTLDKRYY